MNGDHRNIISKEWAGMRRSWLILWRISRIRRVRARGKVAIEPRLFLSRAIIPTSGPKTIAAGTFQTMRSLSLILVTRQTPGPATRERMMLALLTMSTLLGDPDYSTRNRRDGRNQLS